MDQQQNDQKKEQYNNDYSNSEQIKQEADQSNSNFNHDGLQKSEGKQSKEEWKCLDCNRSYKSYPAFYTHNKLKHEGKPPQKYDIPRNLDDIRKDRGRPRVTDSSNRIKFTVHDKHQQKCEDNIYEFLGKQGQKGDDSGQRDNTVIRGYLKKPIDPAEKFPLDRFQHDPQLYQLASEIQGEIRELYQQLQQRNEWEFVDPLELKPDDLTEFSIYNLKSLFHMLREEEQKKIHTTFVVYLIWVSKELLESAYHEIVIISLVYIQEYWTQIQPIRDSQGGNEIQGEFRDLIQKERQRLKDNFFSKIEQKYQQYKLTLFEDKIEIEQYLRRFLEWYYHFDDNETIESQDQGHGPNYQQDIDSQNDQDIEDYDDEQDNDNDQNISNLQNQNNQDSTQFNINPENFSNNNNH